MNRDQDLNFSREDLTDVLQVVKNLLDAQVTPNFSGRHLILVHREWESSPSGTVWAAFVFTYDTGEVIATTMKLFCNEPEATEYLSDEMNNETEEPRATRH